jgi:hypothetical protein
VDNSVENAGLTRSTPCKQRLVTNCSLFDQLKFPLFSKTYILSNRPVFKITSHIGCQSAYTLVHKISRKNTFPDLYT